MENGNYEGREYRGKRIGIMKRKKNWDNLGMTKKIGHGNDDGRIGGLLVTNNLVTNILVTNNLVTYHLVTGQFGNQRFGNQRFGNLTIW